METLIIIGSGLTVGIIRCLMTKKVKNTKKLRYYNYSKYEIRYKKLDKNINEQSKNVF